MSKTSSSVEQRVKQIEKKAIATVKSIFHQVLAAPKPKAGVTPEQQAREYLEKLIQIALNNPDYIQTESVLRLLTNCVEKQSTLANMPSFFAHAHTNPPSANIITVLIKHEFRQALSQQQKEAILLSLGITPKELENQTILDTRYNEVINQLTSSIPPLAKQPKPLIDIVYLAKEIVSYQHTNKMPVSAVITELAPSMMPGLKKDSAYLLTLLRFELQINTVIKSALKIWIEQS